MDVVLTPDAQKQLDELPVVIRVRVLRIVEELRIWPNVSGAKRLKGERAGYFRKRTGDYRVMFRIEAQRVVIVQIGHRDGFYEG